MLMNMQSRKSWQVSLIVCGDVYTDVAVSAQALLEIWTKAAARRSAIVNNMGMMDFDR
jgi:cAMP phosphodiesterase